MGVPGNVNGAILTGGSLLHLLASASQLPLCGMRDVSLLFIISSPCFKVEFNLANNYKMWSTYIIYKPIILQNILEKKKTLWIIHIIFSLPPNVQTLGDDLMCASVILYSSVSI